MELQHSKNTARWWTELRHEIVISRGGSTFGPGEHSPQNVARSPNILVPTAKVSIVKI